MLVDVHVVPMSSPDDRPPMPVDPTKVIAVVGKTEGNGCVNDFSRPLASQTWGSMVPDDSMVIMSGGTEGVLSPHVTLISELDGDRSNPGAGDLAAGIAWSNVIEPSELGGAEQVDAVALAVESACADGGFRPESAALVLVKCPLLDSTQIATFASSVRTTDTYESMALSRAASALGVAVATGEVDRRRVGDVLAGEFQLWSSTASASAGKEVDRCHVLALGRMDSGGGRLSALTAVMKDACDIDSLLGLRSMVEEADGTVVQVFAKAEASPDGTVRGHRHTMLTDSDIHSTRHARAAVGGLIAGVFGTPAVYVSGGAEFQGPPGGGPITVVWAPRR